MMKKRQGSLEYNTAYTLIEVMLVLAIVSVVLIAAQRPLLEFHRIAVLEQQKAVLRGDFQNSRKQCCGVTFNVSFCCLNQS